MEETNTLDSPKLHRKGSHKHKRRSKKLSAQDSESNTIENLQPIETTDTVEDDMKEFLKKMSGEQDLLSRSDPSTPFPSSPAQDRPRTNTIAGPYNIEEDSLSESLGGTPRRNGKSRRRKTEAEMSRRNSVKLITKQPSALIEDHWNANEIIPGLYIGDADSARDKNKVTEHKISHIVTLIDDFDPLFPNEIKYLVIGALDSGDYDMISNFPETNKFIHNALSQNGRVLVHCHKGVSRSATTVMAYIMKYNELSFDEAVDLVSQKRSIACPNLGFIKQLKLYEAMNYNVNGNTEYHENYRKIKLKSLLSSERFKWEANSKSMQYPYLGDSLSKESNFISSHVYACKMCKHVLCNSSLDIPHSAPEGGNSPHLCNSIFIVPMQWMNSEGLTEENGKIRCPGCNTLIGKWNWKGIECTCSVFQKPGFQLLSALVIRDDIENLADSIRDRKFGSARKSLPFRFSSSSIKKKTSPKNSHVSTVFEVEVPANSSNDETPKSPNSPQRKPKSSAMLPTLRRPKAENAKVEQRMKYSPGTLRNYRGSLELKDDELTETPKSPKSPGKIDVVSVSIDSIPSTPTKKESSGFASPRKLFSKMLKGKKSSKANTSDGQLGTESPGPGTASPLTESSPVISPSQPPKEKKFAGLLKFSSKKN